MNHLSKSQFKNSLIVIQAILKKTIKLSIYLAAVNQLLFKKIVNREVNGDARAKFSVYRKICGWHQFINMTKLSHGTSNKYSSLKVPNKNKK